MTPDETDALIKRVHELDRLYRAADAASWEAHRATNRHKKRLKEIARRKWRKYQRLVDQYAPPK